MAPEPPLLSMSGITKSFPGVRALDGVDLEVQAGEVHCLLGQNGAGKSTLIKVLAGAHQPDDGTIVWRGEPTTLKSPIAAMRLGIATIYQELDLVGHLSVAENVFLGHEPTTAGFVVRGREARSATAVLLKRLGHPEIDPGGSSATSPPPSSRSSPWPGPSPTTSGSSSWTNRRPPSTRTRSTTSSASSATSPRPASPSSTSPTAWRRSAASATGSPSSRTAAPSPADCPPSPPRLARSSP